MMIKALDLKLLRDLRRLRGQAFAVALVLAGGVGVQIMMAGSWVSLDAARAAFYERLRFADVFVSAKRAPRSIAAQLSQISGVQAVEARIRGRALARAPDGGEYATAKVLSLPAGAVNLTALTRGRLPRGGFEALASEAFADARGIKPGDALEAVIRGKRLTLSVVGAARSPEFVLALPPGGLVPDNKRHGVLWMTDDTLAAALDFDGAFNDAGLILRRDANFQAVIARIDRLLAPYGGGGAYRRDEQESDAFLDAEIVQMKNFGGLVPPIFMAVAAFLLHLALGRAVAADRGRIGLLKALGYSNFALAAHYGKMALAIAAPGAVGGIVLGFYLGGLQMDAYAAIFRLPDLDFAPRLRECAIAAGVAVGAALLGAASAVRAAAKLAPAEAMTPPPPPVFRARALEKMLPLEKMRATTRCIVRNLLRWPLRALATSLGLGAAGALMMFGFFIGDAFDLIQRSYFEGAERQDATIHFTEHKTPDILREVMRLPGVLTAEPLYAAPARLSFGRESKRRAIFGVSPGAQMMRPIDKNHNPARVAPRGVVLARGLAKSLGASLGDEISIAALEGRRARGEVKITGISDELIGTAAYMNIQALGDFLGEGPRISGALLRIDGNYAADLRRSLPSLPAVASLVFKEDSRRGFEETVESGMLFAAFITIGLAAVIIAGVAYNAARVSLAFRRRELATLRVLGFDRAQAARVLLGEIAVVAAVALPLCAVLGRGLVEYLAAGASNDLYQMPAVVSPRSYALDMLTVAAAVALACIPAKRELDRMDLSAAVKARE